MKRLIAILIISFLLIVILFYYFNTKNLQSENIIKVSGNIEATEVRLSFQVAGQIKRLFADEGYYIKKGQIAAIIDSNELSKIKEQAQANLEQAQSDFDTNKKYFTRYGELLEKNAVSVQDLDAAKNNLQVAQAKLNAAQKALELASIRLNYARLTSPVEGFVIVKSAEAGEVIQPGSTVFTVADTNDIWLTAYINETDLGKARLNQKVFIETDSYPDKVYEGRISFISEEAEFTPKFIQTTEERIKLVYRIKITINNPTFELKPGMPADGYIRK
jgi:HlyD family secretion protein